MENLLIILLALAVEVILFGGLGAYISDQKGRGLAEGLILGVLFGPLGCLVAAYNCRRLRASRP